MGSTNFIFYLFEMAFMLVVMLVGAFLVLAPQVILFLSFVYAVTSFLEWLDRRKARKAIKNGPTRNP